MTNDPSTSLPLPDKVTRKNPKVNTSVVAAHERLERELKKLGVEIKPSSYNIEPAFGRHPFGIRNRNGACISSAGLAKIVTRDL